MASQFLRFHGVSDRYAIRFDLGAEVDAILIVDPRPSATICFARDEIRAYKESHPEVRVIHRVNENDKRKATGFMDEMLCETNQIADFTIFISRWLRDYHSKKWFDEKKSHGVVINGADPAVFHPIGSRDFRAGESLRLVTHHWSDNPMKGFPVYKAIDRMIDEGALPQTELWIIGRWPAEIQWRSARTFGPCRGQKLADLLRQCHLYVTASLWEPGGMHFIEGAQCGLPLLFHKDGGGINEVGKKIGLSFDENIKETVEQARNGYAALRSAVLEHAPSGDRMCLEYRRMIQQVLCGR